MFLIVNITPHTTITVTLLTPLNFGHVHASFLHTIELHYVRCQKLVQERTCTRNSDRRASFLCKSTYARFLYKFLDCMTLALDVSCSA